VLPLLQISDMSGILFDEIVFGPLKSRRFGISLGINLLPADIKICSFNCIYCECGLTKPNPAVKSKLFKPGQIRFSLEQRFKALQQENVYPDSLTFAGNGEPTLHPQFATIVDDVVKLRDTYFPRARVTVLSNATMLHKESVRKALLKIDGNVLKLDAGTQVTFDQINRPSKAITLENIVNQLCDFEGHVIIQTMFLRGSLGGQVVDNTTEAEVSAWLGHLARIRPKLVMLYPIDRRTPVESLQKIPAGELDAIATRVKQIGINAEVYN
jgi:wyosine [tRNA(Phe)-imidazoG37] synthetase (radical SAM superfamily)